MKKLISTLLAVAMLCVIACAAFAEDVPQAEAGKKFESSWVVPGGRADIFYEEQGYKIALDIVNLDENKGTLWQYACTYDEGKDALVSVSSSRTDYTVKPDSNDKVYGDPTYEDIDEENQTTAFTIDQDGFLIWKNGREDVGADLKFKDIGWFDGVWENKAEEVNAEIIWNGVTEDEMFFTVYITRGKTDGETYSNFLMNADYDPASGKLKADGTCTVFKKNADGEYESEEDGEVYEAVFSKTEEGNLLYETDNGIVLEKVQESNG